MADDHGEFHVRVPFISKTEMAVYLAGPMRGYPELNFPAFARVAKRWRELGHVVHSPAEQEEPPHGGHLPLWYYLRHDFALILLGGPAGAPVDGLVLLDGWEMSEGARKEVRLALDIHVPFFWDERGGELNREVVSGVVWDGHAR